MRFIAMEVRELMAQMGYRQFYKMVGRSEHLEMRRGIDHWKARTLDFSRMLWKPTVSKDVKRTFRMSQEHGLEKALDATTLIPLCRPAIEARTPVSATLPISNVNRTVGTMLGSEITRRWGAEGLPEDTIRLRFQGSAGQSFGAFIPKGLTLSLEGDANDYLGKGLSGGRIVVFPPSTATFVPEENVVIGNVACYGATAGETFIRGLAGERFCVRNSGATAVVEGIGDHGCEYMTGGEVVILGRAGRNFGAGMSGGIAWVLDESGDFPFRSNRDLVGMGPVEDPLEAEHLKDLITRHATATHSRRAASILRDWDTWLPRFVRVMPHDYERVLESQARMREKGLPEEEAVLAAFEENARSLARADGN
jgi:glutamate synthase (ferredoxin)